MLVDSRQNPTTLDLSPREANLRNRLFSNRETSVSCWIHATGFPTNIASRIQTGTCEARIWGSRFQSRSANSLQEHLALRASQLGHRSRPTSRQTFRSMSKIADSQ